MAKLRKWEGAGCCSVSETSFRNTKKNSRMFRTFFLFVVCVLGFVLFLFFLLLLSNHTVAMADISALSLSQPAPLSLDYHDLKTGDILTLAYKDKRTFFSAIATGSVWFHTGVVMKKDNELFVLECTIYRPKEYRGLIEIPLQEWRKINRKHVKYAGVLSLNKPASSELLLSGLNQMRKDKVGVQWFDVGWLRFLSSKTCDEVAEESYFCSKSRPQKCAKFMNLLTLHNPLLEPDKHDYFLTCGEVTIELLRRAGVFESDCSSFTPCSYFPKHIVERCIPMAEGFEYEPLKLVVL